MNYPHFAINALLAVADRTVLLIGARTIFSLLLVAVQLYVLRAMLRTARSMQLTPSKEKLLTVTALTLTVIVKLTARTFHR